MQEQQKKGHRHLLPYRSCIEEHGGTSRVRY